VHRFKNLPLITSRVPARPDGLWTLVARDVEGGALLRITASADARWSYSDTNLAICNANGDPRALISRARCLHAEAPVGALIGKIGGSTAGAADGHIFIVGTQCTTTVPDAGGPLYLTINDEAGGMDNNANEMTIKSIEIAQPNEASVTTGSKPASPDQAV